jgi:hypothetical protein
VEAGHDPVGDVKHQDVDEEEPDPERDQDQRQRHQLGERLQEEVHDREDESGQRERAEVVRVGDAGDQLGGHEQRQQIERPHVQESPAETHQPERILRT